jgi:hypothetical protein
LNFFQDGCGSFHPVSSLVVHFVSGERGGGESEHYESQYELFHDFSFLKQSSSWKREHLIVENSSVERRGFGARRRKTIDESGT